MKRKIKKICKLNLMDNYNNARKVADDMVIAIIKNKEKASTYASSVTLNRLGKFMKWCKGRKHKDYDWDSEKLHYTIEVYKVFGNRKSSLSVTENDELKQVIIR